MFLRQQCMLSCLILVLACFPLLTISSPQAELIGKWAERVGRELNDLGKITTKYEEIKQKYLGQNAQVVTKDPGKLLDEIIQNVHRMLNRKMDAIKCILKVAETSADNFHIGENFTEEKYFYHNSKFSPGPDDEPDEEEPMYLPLNLNNDTHFYNIPVDTNISSVHVPTNIYDKHMEPKYVIQWSEALNDVFKKNYESDPALSWQYFGSSSGIMRHFPAMRWQSGEADLFDCRIRTWYIEAATCTKDVVILIDNSGSMQGMNKHISMLTVDSILDTFSNNDYINVLNYSTHLNYTVPCFKNVLMKATRENIQRFKDAVRYLDPKGKTNIEQALVGSLKLLKEYRDKRGCNDSLSCNQAVMIITDGVSKNLSDILLKYNREDNGTDIPVRVFTYLIGKEPTKKAEISWMACNNRGYHSHIESLEQVTGAVYKYIKVIARPLVLQAEQHPISWTHAYADPTSLGEQENELEGPLRLLTSAAIPAFDLKSNENNESRKAQLLGVAGTDVPIDDIRKLTFPHKIGVNAHAFIISNNGYILMHPGLRPIFRKHYLKPNYNSVDLTEVLQLDDGLEPRDISGVLAELRDLLINSEEGVQRDIHLKYHYNDMERVSRETFDFHYKRLNETPFTIGLAFSNRFGYYAVQVPDEIRRNWHTGTPLKTFFQGENWKIHPKWVYCKYHYLEGHESNSTEEELLSFLDRMYDRNFKWSSQYSEETESNDEDRCNRKTLDKDSYYCDKDLIQMLIFDAKSTVEFNEPWEFRNDRDERLCNLYSVTLRFVSTMSGLTRWHYLYGEGNETKMEFGDFHAGAQDETWYKGAVLQHQYDPESFVYTIPVNPQSIDDLLVTGSYAIFPKDGMIEAPASVVGFQFSHKSMTTRVREITSSSEYCDECITCGEHLDCYIIDSSGYIFYSPIDDDTGNFFGEVQRAVMESMLHENIFEQVTLYDYQAMCFKTVPKVPKGSKCSTTTQSIFTLFNWVITKIVWWFIEVPMFDLYDGPLSAYADNPFDDSRPVNEKIESKQEATDDDKLYFPCDQMKTLFILNQTKFIQGGSYDNEVETNCSTTYYVKRIRFSNLLLVAVKVTAADCDVKLYTNRLQQIIYPNNTKHPCQKMQLNDLPRRNLAGCYNDHYLEREIQDCGWPNTGSNFRVSPGFIAILMSLLLLS